MVTIHTFQFYRINNYTDHASTMLSTGLENDRLSYIEKPCNPNELIILMVN